MYKYFWPFFPGICVCLDFHYSVCHQAWYWKFEYFILWERWGWSFKFARNFDVKPLRRHCFLTKIQHGSRRHLAFLPAFLPECHYCAGNSHHRVSVCVCVTRRYCIKMAKRRITQTTPRDSPESLVFWRQNSLLNDPHFPLKFALKVTQPLLNTKISTNIRS